jgi:hypothetical protein
MVLLYAANFERDILCKKKSVATRGYICYLYNIWCVLTLTLVILLILGLNTFVFISINYK